MAPQSLTKQPKQQP